MITVSDVRRGSRHALFSEETYEYLRATVATDTLVVTVSQYRSEAPLWMVDSTINHGMPLMVHGEGARDCAKHTLLSSAAALVDEAVAAAGLGWEVQQDA